MQRYGPPPAYPFLKIPGVNIPDDDTSAMATPGLWDEPDFRYTKEFIWNFDTDKSHWYHYNKDDMIEEENENDDEEKDLDDMGNDQDDLEISDEEKPDISGLFIKQDDKQLLDEGIKNDKIEDNINKETKMEEDKIMDEKEKNENVNENKESEKFYKVIEQEKVDLKNNELNPVGYKYNISGINENQIDNKVENNQKKENKEEEEEEEDEQDIENINKNIFD